jgi:hypothetical protein
MNPVITPTPTALKMMTDTAAIATIGLTLLVVSGMVASLACAWKLQREFYDKVDGACMTIYGLKQSVTLDRGRRDVFPPVNVRFDR